MKLCGFGDSITAGQYLAEKDRFLHKLAVRFGFEIVNAGVPGNTSGQAMSRFESDVISHRPDVCLVAFGMNDHVNVAPQTAKTPIAEFRSNLAHFLDRLCAERIAPVLCTISPIIEGDAEYYYYHRHPQEWYRNPDGAQKWIDAYNDDIRNVASSLNVPLADVAQRWQKHVDDGGRLHDLLRTVENSGTDDGVHPTAAGHDLFAECIGEVLARLLSQAKGV